MLILNEYFGFDNPSEELKERQEIQKALYKLIVSQRNNLDLNIANKLQEDFINKTSSYLKRRQNWESTLDFKPIFSGQRKYSYDCGSNPLAFLAEILIILEIKFDLRGITGDKSKNSIVINIYDPKNNDLTRAPYLKSFYATRPGHTWLLAEINEKRYKIDDLSHQAIKISKEEFIKELTDKGRYFILYM